MTRPLVRPPRKNPILRTRVPTLPPGVRSRVALGLTAAAARGRFELQVCRDCGTVQYPPREACRVCLSQRLDWRAQDGAGELVSETMLRHSNELFYRERMPWRLGMVRLDCGPDRRCASARRLRAGAVARARLCQSRPRRSGCTGRDPGEGHPEHGRRSPASRNDVRSEIPQSFDHRRQDRARAGPRRSRRCRGRRSRLGRPCRAVEEAAGLRAPAWRSRRSRWCRSI